MCRRQRIGTLSGSLDHEQFKRRMSEWRGAGIEEELNSGRKLSLRETKIEVNRQGKEKKHDCLSS